MLNTTEGDPIGLICGGRRGGKCIRLNTHPAPDDDDDSGSVDSEDMMFMSARRVTGGEIKVPDGEVNILPTRETERIYIAGKSGCGKSTIARDYMIYYLQMFPRRRVILFSRHAEETTYLNVPHTAIKLDSELVDTPIDLTELKDSLIVFDDTDNIQDKGLAAALQKLNDDIISNGRKYNIHCLTLAHQLLNGNKSRNLLNEANRVVFFNNGTTYHISNYLKRYSGLATSMVKKILALPSRWTLISHGTPMYILHQHGAFLLNSADD